MFLELMLCYNSPLARDLCGMMYPCVHAYTEYAYKEVADIGVSPSAYLNVFNSSLGNEDM